MQVILLNEYMQYDGDILLSNLDMCPCGTYILMILTQTSHFRTAGQVWRPLSRCAHVLLHLHDAVFLTLLRMASVKFLVQLLLSEEKA